MLEKDAMDILLKFLDKKSREAEEEITQRGTLSDDKAIPLILKTQFNHIAHLEQMVDERFEQVDRRFEQVDRRFEQVDERFEQVDERFEQVDRRFEQMDQRLEQMDQRLGQMDRSLDRLDKRFESLDGRFGQINRHLMAGFAFLSLLLAAFRFVR